MKYSFRRSLVAAPVTALSLALTTLPATAQENSRPSFWQVFTVENMATAFFHSAIGWARLLADIRYDQISVDPMALRVTLTGVSIAPYLPFITPGGCTVTIERLTLNGQAFDQIGSGRLRLALDGASMPSTCLPPEQGGLMRGFGYDALDINRIEAEFNYDYPSGGADIRLSADVHNLVSVNAAIDLDYFSYRMNFQTQQPIIAVDLNNAQISIDDHGAWELAKKLIPPSLQTPARLGQIISSATEEVLAEANGPGGELSEKQRGFAVQAGAIAAEFDASRGQIVLATQIQDGPLHLNEATFRAFAPLFDRLNPTVMPFAPALNTTISVAELSVALDSENQPENAFVLGRALVTGIGAPRNPNSGLRFLVPLARQGNTDASLLVAQTIETSFPADAYEHALRAAAANQPGALALLDRIERKLPYETIIAAQNSLMDGTDEALYRDLAGMRRAARGFLTGTSHPRAWRAAYYWSSMAAATGDATGAAMRDEINEILRLRGDAVAWADETESLDNGVLRDWLGNDVPALLR